MLRVFIGEAARAATPCVFLDGAAIPVADCQRVATDLAFSETTVLEEVRQVRTADP